MNRTEAAAFAQRLNDIGERRHLRVVPVDPTLLYDYIDSQSYKSWEESEED